MLGDLKKRQPKKTHHVQNTVPINRIVSLRNTVGSSPSSVLTQPGNYSFFLWDIELFKGFMRSVIPYEILSVIVE